MVGRIIAYAVCSLLLIVSEIGMVGAIDFPIYAHTKKVKRRIKLRKSQSDFIPLVAVLLDSTAIVLNIALVVSVILLETVVKAPKWSWIPAIGFLVGLLAYTVVLVLLKRKYDEYDDGKKKKYL